MHFYGIKLGHAVRLLPARLAQLDDVSVLERYADSRESEGAARTTVAKEIRAVGTMLRDAKKRKLWLGDVDAVLPDYADDYKPRERRLSTDEFRSLLYAIAQPDNAQEAARAFNRAAMVAFMVITGARWSEVCRAELKDIDLATGHILLRGSKTKKAKAGRRVPITRLVSEFLGACIMPVVRDRRSGPLFDRWTNVWRDLGVACDQAKILRVTANDLRRTFGGWLRAAGVAPDLIGDAMGHVDSRMVLRVYGRLKPGELKGLLDATIAPQLTVGHVSGDADETHPNQE